VTFQEHREGIEPSLPHYECGVLPLDHQCLLSVGLEGLEPSPAWVRTRDAAANTSIPFVCLSSVGAVGVEPTAHVL
jgi:hypothetical protein